MNGSDDKVCLLVHTFGRVEGTWFIFIRSCSCASVLGFFFVGGAVKICKKRKKERHVVHHNKKNLKSSLAPK